jgi:hypothetical protein
MTIRTLLDPMGGRYQGTVFATRDDFLPPAVWLGLPVALLAASIVCLVIDRDLFIWWVGMETGPGENLTAISFVASGVLAFLIARRKITLPVAWLRGGFYAISALALLIAGEEWSWGQHFFRWETPDWLAEVNKQRETNLHNVAENALDQKPRAVFTFTILLVGFLIPLFRRRITWLDRYPFVDWLMPSRLLIPTTLIVFFPRAIERFQLWFDISLPEAYAVSTRDYQELQELYISLFVLIYLANLLLRIRRYEMGRDSD